MLISILIITGGVVAVAAVAVFVYSVIRAPAGAEVETGFSYTEEISSAPERHSRAPSTSHRSSCSAKPFKKHIPAA